MRNLQTIVLPILILGGLIIFTVENWSPTVPLTLFGAKTIALPLSLWVLAACLLGALTTVAIALCLTLLIRSSSSSTQERVQFVSAVPPRSPKTDNPRPSPKSARSRPSRVESRPPEPEQDNRPYSPAVSSETRETNTGDPGMGDWEEFTRPREEWEDWQRSTPVVTEVAGEQPIPGSRFATVPRENTSQPQDSYSSEQGESSRTNEYADYGDRPSDRDREERDRPESYAPEQYGRNEYAQHDEYAQTDYERRDSVDQEYEQGYERDRNSYDRDDYGSGYSEDYRPTSYRTDVYSQGQYAQYRYDDSREERRPYPDEDYTGDRYEPNRGERYYQTQDDYGRPYGANDYREDDQYGPDNDYGQGYSQGDDSAPSSAEPSEQYIMDYGDEAALDAFDAELDARSTSRTRTASDNENPSRTGRYRWKNPFNAQNRRRDNESDDDLDLSSLDDWEE